MPTDGFSVIPPADIHLLLSPYFLPVLPELCKASPVKINHIFRFRRSLIHIRPHGMPRKGNKTDRKDALNLIRTILLLILN